MKHNWSEKFFLVILLGALIGLPIAVYAFNSHQLLKEAGPGKLITLTGSIDHGWTEGTVSAWKMFMFTLRQTPATQAVIEVNRGERVVLKLISSDVVHGFSLKDYGVFVNQGIQPGMPALVSFVADKPGEFTFTCNAICGKNHETMKGTLIVRS
jgi:heme/copper-type cytochrome/quinol oxidase subunit 2